MCHARQPVSRTSVLARVCKGIADWYATQWQEREEEAPHFMRNLLSRVPKSAQALVASFVRTIFAQPGSASTHRQHASVVEQLELPRATYGARVAIGMTFTPSGRW